MCRSIGKRFVVNHTSEHEKSKDEKFYNKKVYPNDVKISYSNSDDTMKRDEVNNIENLNRMEAIYSDKYKDNDSLYLRVYMLEKKVDSIFNKMNDQIINPN